MAIIKPDPEWWMPAAWPLFWRRAFLLTLPISGPLWVALIIASCLVLMVLALVIGLPAAGFFYLKEELWDEPQTADDVGASRNPKAE